MSVFEGIRVLDFGRFIAGPYCAALLADFGADVIRIDRVGGSEDRYILPVAEGGDGAFFLQCNRNKRSVTLNLDGREGRAIAAKLLATADVVIANMPPATLQDLGLDYESLRRMKPDIILTASSAFGFHEAARDKLGFDGVGQALSGAVHLAGSPEQPVKAMVPVVDFATAISCAFGTVMALYERQRSGRGQEVTASLLQSGLTLASGVLLEEAVLHLDRRATLNRSQSYGPSDIFRVADGWIIAQVIGSAMFRRWTELVGRPELFGDPRFADDGMRGEHGEVLSTIMGEWCAKLTRERALALLAQARIPAGRVNSPRQVFEDASIREAQPFQWVSYPGIPGTAPIIAPPVTMTRTPWALQRRPPAAGEHNDEVLEELGYSAAAIENFRRDGVI